MLIRSISTSSSWLIPTMKMFTHQAATSVQKRSKSSAPSALAGERRRGDREEREDAERRADDRVRAAEAPQQRRRAAPARRAVRRERARQRLPGSAHGTDANDPVEACAPPCRPATAPRAPIPRGATRAATTASGWRATSGASPSRAGASVVVVLVAVNRDAAGGRGACSRWPRTPAASSARRWSTA